MTRSDMPAEVARYYDKNTRRFLAFGGGRRSLSIHRELWGPGVADRASAAGYVNQLIGDAIESVAATPSFSMVDFGCGVGGTLLALADRFPDATLHGITISPRQAELAGHFADRRGLGSRCHLYCDDFETCDIGTEVDIVIAVEAMAHAKSATAFLRNVARHVEAGGTLLVVDDFVVPAYSSNEAARSVYRDFSSGWRLPSLMGDVEFIAAATDEGFELVERKDLTPLIRLDRARDRVIGVIAPLLRPFIRMPMCANFVGGAALTRGQRAGYLSYQWLQFRR